MKSIHLENAYFLNHCFFLKENKSTTLESQVCNDIDTHLHNSSVGQGSRRQDQLVNDNLYCLAQSDGEILKHVHDGQTIPGCVRIK